MAAPTETSSSGFWGLILEEGKSYSKTVDVPFQITSATVNTYGSGTLTDGELRVTLEADGMTIAICSFSKASGMLHCPLDLKFEEGSKIVLYTNGFNEVHLSGNILGSKAKFGPFAIKSKASG